MIRWSIRVLGLVVLLFLFYLKGSSYAIFEEFKSLHNKLDIVVDFLIFFITLSLAILALKGFYRRRKKLKRGQTDNLIVGTNNIYYLLLIGGGIADVLLLLGFDLFTFFTSLSIFAAAFAVLSKDYISNIISGMLIAFSDEINIDDFVQIAGKKGKVIDITLSKFILLNDDDDYVILPNNTVFNNEIINYTKREIKKTSIDFEIDIKLIDKVESLEEELKASISKYHSFIKEDSYRLKIVEIKKDFISMKFQYVLEAPDRDLEKDIRKITARRIVEVIRDQKTDDSIA